MRTLVGHVVACSLSIFAMLGPRTAYAAYASVPPPAGYTGSGTARSYLRAAASTYTWASGKVNAATSMNVAGRVVPMTVRFTAAANAAAAVAQYIRVHPALWGGAAVAAFLFPIYWDATEDRWEVPGTDTVWKAPTAGDQCYRPSALASSLCSVARANNQPESNFADPQLVNSSFGCHHWSWRYTPTGSRLGNGNSACVHLPGTAEREALDDDWEEVEVKPFPNAVPNEVEVPVPVVTPPVLNPDEDGEPGTLRVPLGEPYAIPGTDPQQWRQPALDIVPAPSSDDPLRVDLQPKELAPESREDGLDEPEIVEDGDEAAPGEGLPPPGLCETNPDASACAALGQGDEGPAIPNTPVPLEISPFGAFGPSTASCPEPRTVSVAGLTLSMPFTLLCQFAEGIRPIVIAMAWVGAVLGFMGLGRRENG